MTKFAIEEAIPVGRDRRGAPQNSLEIGERDGQRHSDIYAALETE